MKILDFPIQRQSFSYDCGAKALQSVLEYYGIDTDESNIIKLAGTNDEIGTPIHGMEKVARHFGLDCIIKSMTIDEIKKSIDDGTPVILLVQAWANREVKDWKRTWREGHYVVAIGHDSEKIYFDDPKSCIRTYLPYSELEERWHGFYTTPEEKNEDLGIIIAGKDKTFSSKAAIHMD
jgi:ABC-type bacteriocin/lantibiotic exporter with double-glycine peptidase domain